MDRERRINHPEVKHIDWYNQTEFARAERLHNIPRYHTIEEMTHRTSVLVHSLRVTSHALFVSQVLDERGVDIDRGKTIFLADHHDDPEIITGDIPTPVKRNATKEERDQMEEQERKASEEVDHYVQKPLFRRSLPVELEEYRKQDSLESRVVNYLDKWDAIHECVQEVVTGDNKAQFKQILEEYRDQMNGLNSRNSDWLGVVSPILGNDFSEFPEPDGLSPKRVEDLEFNEFSTFLQTLTSENPNSYRWWLMFNKSAFGLDFFEAVFPGWMEKFPKSVINDIQRVKRGEPLKKTPTGLWVPSGHRDGNTLTFGEGMQIDILSARLSALSQFVDR